MRCKVEMHVNGNRFTEYMEANGYEDAKRTALARNPTAKVVSCNLDNPVHSTSSSSSGSYNAPRRVGTNNSGENSAGGLGGLIILGLLGMGLMGLFGDDETPKTKQYNNSQAPQVERTYTPPAPPVVRESQPLQWSYERPSSDNFFTNTGIQEEVIDDLGQDWDN